MFSMIVKNDIKKALKRCEKRESFQGRLISLITNTDKAAMRWKNLKIFQSTFWNPGHNFRSGSDFMTFFTNVFCNLWSLINQSEVGLWKYWICNGRTEIDFIFPPMNVYRWCVTKGNQTRKQGTKEVNEGKQTRNQEGKVKIIERDIRKQNFPMPYEVKMHRRASMNGSALMTKRVTYECILMSER